MQQRPLLFSLFFFFFFFLGFASAADYLQNPDFESPPKNLTGNGSSVPFVLLNENNTIPGWTFQGTVQYVTAGPTVALPDNGHAIQLGQDARINQTFEVDDGDYTDYILTFTLAPGGQNCSVIANMTVSGTDNQGIFSFKPHYGKQAWQSYGLFLGLGGQGETMNLEFESQAVDSDDNSTCWPVIDSLLVKAQQKLVVQGKDNLLPNGGFEIGPEFLSNSTEGVLLDSTLSPLQSPLEQWAVVGTIRYIDSEHFFVPHGNAAVELVSGVSAGILTQVTLTEGSEYNLGFTLGDANNTCEGDFMVEVRAGSVVQDVFTITNNGTGSAGKYAIKFKANSSATIISFSSSKSSQTKDGVLCGPVVDDVVVSLFSDGSLSSSDGSRIAIKPYLLICLLLLLVILG